MSTLRGERIELRPVEERDLAQIVMWRNDPKNRDCFFNREPLTLEGQQPWFDALQTDPTRCVLIVCEAATGKAVGTIGLDHLDADNQQVEFGNMLIGDPESRRHGYAQEATKLLLSHCFTGLNMHRVHLAVFADNENAIQLYQRCGFRSEGTLRDAHFAKGQFRDVLMMSILRREYEDGLSSSGS